MSHRWLLPLAVVAICVAAPGIRTSAEDAKPAPFNYVHAKAYHIMPECTSNESGYFALCEGKNKRIYVGATKYGVNSFLIEFDPQSEKQRVVIDTHKLCGLTDKGYAAQAKIHTRNFVGPSGKIYVGSKQGYRLNNQDTADYPGGYVMTYDPTADKAENLGMPMATEGVIDTVADESRGIIYVVTCEAQHWMRYDVADKKYTELGPLLTPYATTLVDAKGKAHSITANHELATYDPQTKKVRVRPLDIDGSGGRLGEPGKGTVPTWVIAKDNRTAYLIRLSEATLFEIDLLAEGDVVRAVNRGKMHPGKNADLRCALSLAPDGRLYAAMVLDNPTGYGPGRLQHILRYDPATQKSEDLGAIVVDNPDFAKWTDAEGKPLPFRHGYSKLPDGKLTLQYEHMGLIAASDGSVYMIHLYPYTLLKMTPK